MDKIVCQELRNRPNKYLRAMYEAAGNEIIANWQDVPGRTFAEVIALLDKAIACAASSLAESLRG